MGMTSETKHFIETHIDLIESNGIASAYIACPLRMINDFNNTMHIAGIEYPPEMHVYVVLCCYITTRFTNAYLQCYDFDYDTDKEEYEFICDNCLYIVEQLNHDLSVLLPKRSINANIAQHQDFRGITSLKIRVEVN
jgi:hypothetical protein